MITDRQVKDAYKFQCSMRYWTISLGYIIDFISKAQVAIFGWIVAEGWLPVWILAISAPIAFIGYIIDLITKLYHLRETKFRKKGFYQRRTNALYTKQGQKTYRRRNKKSS